MHFLNNKIEIGAELQVILKTIKTDETYTKIRTISMEQYALIIQIIQF